MKHKILSAILAFTLTFCILPHTGMAAGTDELSTAVEYVTAQNIFVGDGSGNLDMDSGLTRAELAVLLVRMRGDEETVKADAEYYSFGCHFDDVPEWAEPYVGYCADWQLLNGYSLFVYAPNDRVTPQQACTVILRNMGITEKTWSYATAVSDAGELGITPASGFTDMSAVKRGEMAVLIHKSATRPANGTTGTDQGQTKVLDGNSYAREDFSAQANPAVFDDYYTRGIYNVVRQMILDYDVIAAGMDENGYNPDYDYPHVIGHDKSYYVIDEVFGTLMAYHRYQRFGEPGVKNIWQYPSYSSATILPRNQHMDDVDTATNNIIIKADAMSTDADKVRYFSEYIQNRIIYNGNESAGTLLDVFGEGPTTYGVCRHFASAFKYLCDKAGIPVLYISGTVASGERHGWNIVYIDGQWLYTDVTTNRILQTDYTFATNETPRLTEFVKEVLVPGSTK